MSYYRVVDDYRAGMPQTIMATVIRGIACHTTEGGEGEAGAIGTLNFLIQRADRNASYHEFWYPKQGGFEARRIVRPDRAAHSMNPTPPPGGPWNPNARVRTILGDRAWNPNGSSYAVSIAGSTGITVPKLVKDPGFMAGARRRYAEIQAQFRTTMHRDPLYNHGEGQPSTRTDWGPLMRPAILTPPQEADDMFSMRSKIQPWTFKPGARVYEQPSRSAPVLFTFGANGGKGVTVAEEATYDGLTVVNTHVWRLLLLTNSTNGRRLGWVHRQDMDPVPMGDFDEELHRLIWGGPQVLSDALAAGGVSTGITEDDVKAAVAKALADAKVASDKAIADARTAERDRIANAERQRIRGI